MKMDNVSRTAGYLALLVGCVVALTPLVWMVLTSLKEPSAIFLDPPQWLPDPWRWENYSGVFDTMPFHRYTLNTLEITALAMFGQLFSSSIVAFGFARTRFPGRDMLFVAVLATMMLPPQVTMVPVFKIFAWLGWYDTYMPLVVPHYFGFPFYIFLLRQYFMSIPHEMDEAAKIDGANIWQIYTRIILPQSKPALMAVALFSFVMHWNDFLGPLIYIASPEKRTLALGLYAFQGQFATDWHFLMAASVLTVIAPLVLFLAGQKYFVQGVVVSGVKG